MENGNGFAEGYAIGADRNSNNNGMWGGDWAWWIVILLIFGWGNGNGFGGNRNGAMEGYVLTSDFANIERKLDGVNNGICSLGYDLQGNLCSGFANTIAAITNTGYETRNAIQGVSSQIANCCCETQKSLLENRYLDAQNTCNIIQNATANTQRIIDQLNANKYDDLKQKYDAEIAKNTALAFQISQSNQNAYLLNELKPCPRPAYITCNPYQSYPYYASNTGCGFATGTATVQ